MTTYYVGPGGNDGNAGTSWALRKLTLNGAEDVPVAPGDIVYVGPGVYRETLTIDISGTGSSQIAYVGDITGENTDGIGGIVRVTGSDDDQSATRANCITATGKSRRTFRGFSFDTTTSDTLTVIASSDSDNWIIEDCNFQYGGRYSIFCNGANQHNWIVRRCIIGPGFEKMTDIGIYLFNGASVTNANHAIENCIVTAFTYAIDVYNVQGTVVKNCVILNCTIAGIFGWGTNHIEVYNCIIQGNVNGIQAGNANAVKEDFNTFWGNTTDRAGTMGTGANSKTYPALFEQALLYDGIQYNKNLFALSEWSQIVHIDSTGTATDDLFGITRPEADFKKSWGAIQYDEILRGTGTVRGGSSSLKFEDSSRHQIFVPSSSENTKVSVFVYREGGYGASILPEMVIKQPGQSDRITTDTGLTGTWNELTDTFTPASLPPYFVVELVSHNTGSSNANVYFDDLSVTGSA
jgi:hypothetical protein